MKSAHVTCVVFLLSAARRQAARMQHSEMDCCGMANDVYKHAAIVLCRTKRTKMRRPMCGAQQSPRIALSHTVSHSILCIFALIDLGAPETHLPPPRAW